MESTGTASANAPARPGALRLNLSEKTNFLILCGIYLTGLVGLFLLSLGELPLNGYHLEAGIVVGGIFPILTLLYYSSHYLGNRSMKSGSLASWFLPSLFVQIIIVFGFLVTLGARENYGYRNSMYIGFYTYGKLFKTYTAMEGELIEGDADRGDARIILHPKQLEQRREKIASFLKPYFDEDRWRKGKPEGLDMDFTVLSNSVRAIPYAIAIAFGFLGALIFCLRDVIKRFNNVDMYPKICIFYGVRFIVSCTLSVCVGYWVMEEWPATVGPTVFFMIGYFPERVITYLDERMSRLLGTQRFDTKPVKLSLVQGITPDKAIRLREVDIEDVQNLATGSIERMAKNLPFTRALICDWIAQSLLVLHFTEDIEKFRKVGIRTILDLDQCALKASEAEVNSCAEMIGVHPAQIRHIKEVIGVDYMQNRLRELRDCLSEEYDRR